MEKNIFTLFEKIENKKVFYKAVSEATGRTAQSIEKNWFSGLKRIPKEEQANVVDILHRQLLLQANVIYSLVPNKLK